jgi:hypothetical protein
MAYSWPHTTPTAQGNPTTVDSHLAYSRDRGRSWTFAGPLWTAQPTTDPVSHEPGYWNSEAVGLEVRSSSRGSTWYSVRDRYVLDADGGLRLPTYRLAIATAGSPRALATAPEQTLAGSLTSPAAPVDVDLSSLDPSLDGCTFRDAGLHFERGRLYLATECSRYTFPGEDFAGEFIAVFSTRAQGPVGNWSWSYRGQLADHREALELGADTLQQTDLVEGRDGDLLALLSPSGAGTGALTAHHGCRAIEVASLKSPRLHRSHSGRLSVVASVTSSDSLPDGPGSCGYAPESKTGIVIARRTTKPTTTSALFASGIRP